MITFYKRYIIVIFLIVIFKQYISANISTGTILNSAFDQFSSGCSTSSNVSYSNIGCIGQTSIGNSQSLNYREISGFIPAFILYLDIIYFTKEISFLDEEPSTTDWQETRNVICRITVKSNVGNPITSIRYRISSSGSTNEQDFSSWQTDVTTFSVLGPDQIRFQTTFPNTSGLSLSDATTNYIQWRAKNSGGVEAISGFYSIKIYPNDTPSISILYPDEKGGISGTEPIVKAKITDKYYGIEEKSIRLVLEMLNGQQIFDFTNKGNLNIYSPSTGLLSYQNTDLDLTPNSDYKLTIYATDKDGKTGSASVIFQVKGGAIADLVPYPSPFDPKKEPIIIRYVLNKRSDVTINIYDMGGRLVRRVIDNISKDPGISEDSWDGINYGGEFLANGVYFCELIARSEDGQNRRYVPLAIFGK